jgi:hypothetical protein
LKGTEHALKFSAIYNDFVTWLHRGAVAVALLVTLSSGGYQSSGFAQNESQIDVSKFLPEEEKESYDIWSTVLRIKEPRVTAWTIVQQTRGFGLCLKPAPDQESTYGPMFDDYAAKNKKGFVLERKFKLPVYTLVPPEAWTNGSALGPFAVVSAVGFNRGRTRAAVCLWGRNSGTCYVLLNRGDMWQLDGSWRGNGCGWAA